MVTHANQTSSPLFCSPTFPGLRRPLNTITVIAIITVLSFASNHSSIMGMGSKAFEMGPPWRALITSITSLKSSRPDEHPRRRVRVLKVNTNRSLTYSTEIILAREQTEGNTSTVSVSADGNAKGAQFVVGGNAKGAHSAAAGNANGAFSSTMALQM